MPISRALENRAFQLILEAGKEGILQSEMWKKLGTSSRIGSRIAHNFMIDGIIKRQKELHDGNWTYRIFYLKKQISIDSIIDCPCMTCEDIEKCSPRLFVSPNLCEKLTNWISKSP